MEKLYLLPVVFLLSICTQVNAQDLVIARINDIVDISRSNELYRSVDTLSYDKEDQKRPYFGRKPKKVTRKADKLYSNLGYKASLEKYKSLSKEDQNSEAVISRIANGYRMNGETEDAEFWYEKLVEHTSNPIHLLHYAQVLQSNGQCHAAVVWYNEYEKVADEKELQNICFNTDCEDDEQMNQNVEIQNIKELNSPHLDFSPVPFQDGIVFTSTRVRDQLTEDTDTWTNDNFSDLFYSKLDSNGKYSDPRPFKSTANARYHDGTATFNGGENKMFFTRSNNSKNKDGHYELQIFGAEYKKGIWNNAESLPFNSNEFTSCHPALSLNGRKLYFASNRPGGYGGMDIYVSVYVNETWSEPKNLGPAVNTGGNELFPYLADDGELFFSSNGHKGIGGLDIYSTSKIRERDEQSWSKVESLGKPFNSRKDDFGFCMNEGDENSGFFSSSRDGGRGEDDVYSWKQTPMEEPEPKPEPEPIAKTTEKINTVTYQPVISVPPPIVNTPDYSALFERFLGEADAKFEKGQTFTLNDVYYDYGKAEIRPDASTDLNEVVELLNAKPGMTIELESHTDARGRASYNLVLSQKRAESARNYIISQGIAGHRVKATGYGEDRLKNRCGDGVKCSEYEHQQNRRTEIRIINVSY